MLSPTSPLATSSRDVSNPIPEFEDHTAVKLVMEEIDQWSEG